MNAVSFTTGELTDLLLLVTTFEVELSDISARRDGLFAKLHHIQTIGNFFPYGFIIAQFITCLVDIAQIYGFADSDCTGIRLFLSGNHTEQSGFTGTVRTYNTHNRTLRNFKRQVINQYFITVGFADIFGFNNQITQTLIHRNIDIGLCNFIFGCRIQQLIISLNTGFRLSLSCFRIFLNPFQLISQSFLTSIFFTSLLSQTFLFLFQPRRIVAFIRNTLSTVKFQNPTGNIIQEIAVVGNHNHRSFIFLQVFFEPRNRFGIQVVGRLIKKQHIGLLQQQAAKSHTAFFTTGEFGNIGIGRRTT